MAMAMKKNREEGDARARVPSTAAIAITTKWQDAMTGGGGQQTSHGRADRGIPKIQHFKSSSTNNSSNGMRRSVSFADNVDILSENNLKPLASTRPGKENAANDHRDDEGYEKFLALLASPPAPAQAPPSSPSTSSMTLSITEHDPHAVSSTPNSYLPPSAQTQSATDDGQGELLLFAPVIFGISIIIMLQLLTIYD